ncbi:MAG: 50S ribosomal protein L17, partial [Chitinophagaceae bacterium]
MRHGDKIKNLGRTASHRRALMSNLACQLIQHKRIVTTLAKAKSLRVYVEPMITRSKDDSMHNRRVVFSYLQDKEAIKELFGAIGDKVADRPGGYTRIIKLQPRFGDNAEMAMIELVDFNEIYGKDAKDAAAKKRLIGARSQLTQVHIKPHCAAVSDLRVPCWCHSGSRFWHFGAGVTHASLGVQISAFDAAALCNCSMEEGHVASEEQPCLLSPEQSCMMALQIQSRLRY